jgi:hypothetical protein
MSTSLSTTIQPVTTMPAEGERIARCRRTPQQLRLILGNNHATERIQISVQKASGDQYFRTFLETSIDATIRSLLERNLWLFASKNCGLLSYSLSPHARVCE